MRIARDLISSIISKKKNQCKLARFKERKINRILLISWGRLGELTLSTILLQSLRKRYKNAYISYIVGSEGVGILKNDPNINKLIPANIQTYNELIKDEPYDLAIDLYGGRASLLMAYLSGARYIIFSPKPHSGAKFTTIGIKPLRFRNKNVKDHFLNIARLSGVNIRNADTIKPCLSITENEEVFAKRYIRKLGITENDFIVGLQPGGQYERWSEFKFATLGKHLASALNAKILILQGPKQKTMVLKVHYLIQEQSILLSYLNIREYFALVSRCKLLITTAGGASHAGPALGVPTIIILTAEEYAYWVPRFKRSFYLPIQSKIKIKLNLRTKNITRSKLELTISVKRVLDFINSQRIKEAIERHIN